MVLTHFRSLHDAGIQLRDWRQGNRKTTCPKCSHTRRNKTDRCLSVTIVSDAEAMWHCHHCGWSGGINPDAEAAPKPRLSKAEYRAKKSAEWRRQFASGRAW